jgi:hypothetical protein
VNDQAGARTTVATLVSAGIVGSPSSSSPASSGTSQRGAGGHRPDGRGQPRELAGGRAPLARGPEGPRHHGGHLRRHPGRGDRGGDRGGCPGLSRGPGLPDLPAPGGHLRAHPGLGRLARHPAPPHRRGAPGDHRLPDRRRALLRERRVRAGAGPARRPDPPGAPSHGAGLPGGPRCGLHRAPRRGRDPHRPGGARDRALALRGPDEGGRPEEITASNSRSGMAPPSSPEEDPDRAGSLASSSS